MGVVRRRVLASQSSTLGLLASRAASRRSNSGTVMPAAAAWRLREAYVWSSMSLICTVLGIYASYHAWMHIHLGPSPSSCSFESDVSATSRDPPTDAFLPHTNVRVVEQSR